MIQDEYGDEECTCPKCEPPVYRYRPQSSAAAKEARKAPACASPTQETPVMKLVYICHPFAADPAGNAERVRRICEELKHHGVPLAPHLLLPGFIDEVTERDLALQHCMRLVAACDEVRAYGEPTEGMRLEIAEARRLGIPLLRVVEGP